jgi:hypothetical protein
MFAHAIHWFINKFYFIKSVLNLMFETTILTPGYNGYQYLFVFFVAILLDIIVHFFSLRKYSALKSGTDAFGFAPELMIYYRSLCRKGPLSIDGGIESFYSSCNSWIIGALIAGIVSIIVLFIADLFLHVAETRQ